RSTGGFSSEHPLARLHLGAVLVADEVKHGMHEWRAPRVTHDLRTQHDISELPWHARRHRLAAGGRKRQHVRLLVDPAVLALELADLVGLDQLQAELAVVDSFLVQHTPDQLGRRSSVELGRRAVRELDLDHRPYFRRAVPVSSACSLYASTIRWTSLCLT